MVSAADIPTIPVEMLTKCQTSFYAEPVDAVAKALGVERALLSSQQTDVRWRGVLAAAAKRVKVAGFIGRALYHFAG